MCIEYPLDVLLIPYCFYLVSVLGPIRSTNCSFYMETLGNPEWEVSGKFHVFDNLLKVSDPFHFFNNLLKAYKIGKYWSWRAVGNVWCWQSNSQWWNEGSIFGNFLWWRDLHQGLWGKIETIWFERRSCNFGRYWLSFHWKGIENKSLNFYNLIFYTMMNNKYCLIPNKCTFTKIEVLLGTFELKTALAPIKLALYKFAKLMVLWDYVTGKSFYKLF